MAHSQSVGLVRKSTGDIINTVAPVKIPVAIQLAMSPKSWYSGIQFSATSAGWRPPSTLASLMPRMFASRLAWVSATPLGSPVLPDVY